MRAADPRRRPLFPARGGPGGEPRQPLGARSRRVPGRPGVIGHDSRAHGRLRAPPPGPDEDAALEATSTSAAPSTSWGAERRRALPARTFSRIRRSRVRRSARGGRDHLEPPSAAQRRCAGRNRGHRHDSGGLSAAVAGPGSPGGDGGGILNAGTLTLASVLVANNKGGRWRRRWHSDRRQWRGRDEWWLRDRRRIRARRNGGAIHSTGTLVILDSTITDNRGGTGLTGGTALAARAATARLAATADPLPGGWRHRRDWRHQRGRGLADHYRHPRVAEHRRPRRERRRNRKRPWRRRGRGRNGGGGGENAAGDGADGGPGGIGGAG